MLPKLIVMFPAVIVLAMGYDASATELIADTFALNGTTRTVGAPLIGTTSEVGSVPWVGNTSPKFTGSSAVDNGGGFYAAAFVSLSSAPVRSTIFTVRADVNTGGNAWSSIQFNDVVGGNYDIFNASLSLLFGSNGYFTLYANNYGTALVSGSVVPNAGLNNLQLQYNSLTKTASVWINGVNVINAISVPGSPVLNYAGFGAYQINATPALTQFDNFQLAASKTDVMIADTFALNGSNRTIGAPLIGTSTEVGSVPWVGNTSPKFTGSSAVDNGGGFYAAAFVSLSSAPGGSNIFTVQADVNAGGNAWSSIQFNDVVGGSYDIFKTPLSLLFCSNGYFTLYSNNYGTALVNGSVVPTASLNKLQLQYNSITKTASVWINGVNVINAISVPGSPVLNYAGFGAYQINATPALTQFDNFQLAASRADVMIADTFALNGSNRTIGAPLIGTSTEVGSVPWVGNTSPKFTGSSAVDNGGGFYAAAFVSLSSAPVGSTIFTVRADVNTGGNAWSSIQFNDVVGGNYDIFNASLSFLLRPNGNYALWVNNYGTVLVSGTVVLDVGVNNLRLQYDSVAKTASVWINGGNLINAISVPGSPVLNYAGFGAYQINATPTLTQYDNFQVSAANSLPFPLDGKVSSFNANGNLVVNGQPFFPLGLYSCFGIDQASATCPESLYTGPVTQAATMSRLQAIKAAGFNMLQTYSMQFYGMQVNSGWSQGLPGSVLQDTTQAIVNTGMLQFMNDAQAAGLYVIIGAAQPYCIDQPLPMDGQARDQAMTQLETQLNAGVEAFKNHPGLVAWYLTDEPSQVPPAGIPVADLTDVYRYIKGLDTVHPMMIPSCSYLPNANGSDRKYRYSVDIMSPDPYPIGGSIPIKTIADTLDLMKTDQVGSPAKPQLWANIQICQWVAGRPLPSAAQIRLMALLALTRDVKGLMFYEHKNYPLMNPNQWAAISQAVNSMKSVIPDILASSELVTSYAVSDTRISSIMRTVRNANNTVNHYSLIAVNPTQDISLSPVAVGLVAFNLGNLQLSANSQVSALDEDSSGNLSLGNRRAISLVNINGQYCFNDQFGIYASHLYQIVP